MLWLRCCVTYSTAVINLLDLASSSLHPGTCRPISWQSVTTCLTATPAKRHTRYILIWGNWAGSPVSSIWRRMSRVIAWRTWSIIFWASGSSSRLCATTCARITIAAPIRRISGALFKWRSMERRGYRLPRGSAWRTLCELGRIRPASLSCAFNRIEKPVRSNLRRCADVYRRSIFRRISSSCFVDDKLFIDGMHLRRY